MTQLESSYGEFTRTGAGVIAIAAQKINGLFRGREYIQQHHYSFPVLFDEDRKVTRAYGVYHRIGMDAYNIARPATFVLGKDAKISWIAISPNQTERPMAGEILEAISKAI